MSINRVGRWLLYLGSAIALVGILAWLTIGEIARNPTRAVTTELGSYGLVTLRLTTDPSPAMPTGTVRLSFMPMDARRRTVRLDAVSYEYGPEGSDRPVGSGDAQAMADGSGMFMGTAQFPTVGNWWVRAQLTKDRAQANVRFTLYVEPAQ